MNAVYKVWYSNSTGSGAKEAQKIFFLTHTAGSAGVSCYVDCVRFSFCLAIA